MNDCLRVCEQFNAIGTLFKIYHLNGACLQAGIHPVADTGSVCA